MKISSSFPSLAACLLFGRHIDALTFRRNGIRIPPRLPAWVQDEIDGGSGTFQQYIDHSNPSLGTFSQRYWWNKAYWDGPGSPVFLSTPGEQAADRFRDSILHGLTNFSIMGMYAQETGGATIVLERMFTLSQIRR